MLQNLLNSFSRRDKSSKAYFSRENLTAKRSPHLHHTILFPNNISIRAVIFNFYIFESQWRFCLSCGLELQITPLLRYFNAMKTIYISTSDRFCVSSEQNKLTQEYKFAGAVYPFNVASGPRLGNCSSQKILVLAQFTTLPPALHYSSSIKN